MEYLIASPDGKQDITGVVHEKCLLSPITCIIVNPEHHPPIRIVENSVPIAIEEQWLAPDGESNWGRREQLMELIATL